MFKRVRENSFIYLFIFNKNIKVCLTHPWFNLKITVKYWSEINLKKSQRNAFVYSSVSLCTQFNARKENYSQLHNNEPISYEAAEK